jgi:tetratricopeptide (TPR) repeat protein
MTPVRATRYRWPAGGTYHRYAAHMHLPRAYWIAAYIIEDVLDYALDAPAAGYQWVRYGPDALLIDRDTGEVIDAVYGVFDESAPPDDSQDEQPSSDQQGPPLAGPADEANAGLDALDRGDYDTAVRLLSDALDSGALSPADKEFAYLERAKAYAAEKNEASALADVNAALALDPADQEAIDLREELDPQSGPPLQDTLDFIVQELNGHGTVDFTVQVHDSANNIDGSAEGRVSITAATADASQCTIGYHFQMTIGSSAPQDMNDEIHLGDVSKVEIGTMDQDLAQADVGPGHENRTYLISPAVYDLNIIRGDTPDRLAFGDASEANSVKQALEHAARLCGGLK